MPVKVECHLHIYTLFNILVYLFLSNFIMHK